MGKRSKIWLTAFFIAILTLPASGCFGGGESASVPRPTRIAAAPTPMSEATATPTPTVEAVANKPAEVTVVSTILWQAQLIASSVDGITFSRGNYAGVSPEASNEYDAYDSPEPPAPPSPYIRAYFPHSDWVTNPGNYTTDIRPPSDEITWVFDVENSSAGTVILTWDVSAVPLSYTSVLLVDTNNTPDTTDDITSDLRTAANYRYTGPSGVPRVFNLSVSVPPPLPPVVTVSYPNGGEMISDTIIVTADVSDPDGSVTSVTFAYSPDNGGTWYDIDTDSDGADGWSVLWDNISVTGGSDYLVRAIATDNDALTSNDQSDTTFTMVDILWEIYLGASVKALTTAGEEPTESKEFSDLDRRAGTAREASEQYDTFDVPHVPQPPPPEPFIRLYFPHPGWTTNPDDYGRDMRPSTEEIIWNLEVLTTIVAEDPIEGEEAPTEGGEITLTWDVSQVPSSYGMTLLRDTKNTSDTSDDSMIDMRYSDDYVYSPTSLEPRAFQLVVSEKMFISTTLPAGWHLFSLPLDASPQDWADQLRDDFSPVSIDVIDDIAQLLIYWYDPTIGTMQTWSADSPAFGPTLGRGYWTEVTEDTVIDVEGYFAPDEDFTIHLLPGWNMIGTPFNFSVDWKSVQVSYNGTTASILDAHDNGWVTKFFYSYDVGTGGFVAETVSDGQLEPWQGYWVKVLVESDLIIPNTPMP